MKQSQFRTEEAYKKGFEPVSLLENNLVVLNKKEVKVSALVIHNESVTLNLSIFSIVQLILGASIRMTNFGRSGDLALLFELTKASFEQHAMDSEYRVEFVFTPNQLDILKTWLEARLTHCEKERNEGSPKFNVDSYINMKLLLLDIRDLLGCIIIEIV